MVIPGIAALSADDAPSITESPTAVASVGVCVTPGAVVGGAGFAPGTVVPPDA